MVEKRNKAKGMLTAWCAETRNHLDQFRFNYAGLSHRLLKFYTELKTSAEMLNKLNWRYGFIHIVSMGGKDQQWRNPILI